MQQKLFIDLNENSNLTKKTVPKDHHYEEEFTNLDFILVPYAYLLGIKANHKSSNKNEEKFLLDLFCKNNQTKDSLVSNVNAFIEKESMWFKKDPSKNTRNNNLFTTKELREVFISGAIEIQLRHKSISKIKKEFRKRLPESKPRLVFGKIARYLNNGSLHEFWYEETGKEIEELFPEFDPELIKSLLAITSIRATLPSNVTKSFKALDQYHKDEIYDVPLGKKGDKKIIKSAFKGFLDAQLHHLNLLKKGESLTNPENLLKNGRKIKMFASAMGPVEDAIVDDVWITRAFGCDRKRVFESRVTSQSPSKAIYDATEWYLQTLAGLVGKKARGVCAMIWVGIRQETNKETARYTDPIKNRLNHGLFSAQYGNLKPSKNGGIEFESL
jgi:hypothetical protein